MLRFSKNYFDQRKVFLEAKYEVSFEVKYFENILYLEMESSKLIS
jgi:hypothetical protein